MQQLIHSHGWLHTVPTQPSPAQLSPLEVPAALLDQPLQQGHHGGQEEGQVHAHL